MATEALVGMTASVEIQLFDATGRRTEVFDRSVPVTWDVPAEIEVSDTESNVLDANLRFVAATSAPVRVRATLDADPDAGVDAPISLESDDITIAEPPPGQAVSGSIVIVLHQV